MRVRIMRSRYAPLVLGLALFGYGLIGSRPAAAEDNAEAWLLEFTVGTTQHQGLLLLEDGAGWLRVRYYAPESGRTQIVQMPVALQQTPYGTVLVSGEATDIETGRKHPSYAPDNFWFRTDPDGHTEIVNRDDRGHVAATIAQKISSPTWFARLARTFQVYDR